MNGLLRFAKLLAGLLVLVQLGMSHNAFAVIAKRKGQSSIEVLADRKTGVSKTVHYRTAKQGLYPLQSLAFKLFQRPLTPVQKNAYYQTVFIVQKRMTQKHRAKLLTIQIHPRLQQASYRS